MTKMKFAAMALVILSLAACNRPDKPDINIDIVQPTAPVVVPKADPVVAQPVQWKVYTAAELKNLSDSLAKSGDSVTLFTLDGANFKALSGNLVDIQRYIKEQNEIIVFLKGALDSKAKASAEAAKGTADALKTDKK